MVRHLLVTCLIVVVTALAGCGNSGMLASGTSGPSASLSRPPIDLPAPSTLRLASYTEASLRHSGQEFETAQVPNNGVAPNGTEAVFTPNWDSGASNPRTGMAYAGYIFTADGYDRDFTVRLNWSLSQASTDLFLGLANFADNKWNFYSLGGDASTLTLTSQQFNNAIEPGTGRMVVVVVTKGTQTWQLAEIRLGALPAPVVTDVQPQGGTEGAQVTFTPTLTGGGVDTYAWDFGGGANPNTSSAMSPQVTLTTPGIYPASLTVTNATGNDSFNFNLTVDPSPAPPDIVAAGPTDSTEGATEQFSMTNIAGPASSWTWDFGGGATPNTSTEQSPTVTIGTAGTYTVNLSATNGAGTDNFQFDLNVTVGNPPQIMDVVPQSGAPGSAVSFIPDILGQVDTYFWDFTSGGATPPTNTNSTAAETLSNTPGTYPSSLTATNADGMDTFNFDLVVTNGGGTPPDVTDAQPRSGSDGQVVTFVPTFTGDPPMTWAWDFGGGATPNTSTLEQPQVTLGPAFPPGYSCSVMATNGSGTDTFNFVLDVFPF